LKIAVLSDIHGNSPALAAVIADIQCWNPDRVIVNGDIISRGPYSKKVLEMLSTDLPDGILLTGNHETFVLHCADNPLEPSHERYDFQRFSQWTAGQIGHHWLAEIKQWQDHVDLTHLDGDRSFHVTHGSRVGNRDGISKKTSNKELPKKLGEARDLFVCSHTHQPLVRHFDGRIVVNTGSVGQPLDNDPRSAYGQFTLKKGQWQVNITRVTYDKAQAEKDFYDSGFLDAGGPVAQLIVLEHKHSTPFVGPFMRQYLERVNAKEITLGNAVQQYLEKNTI